MRLTPSAIRDTLGALNATLHQMRDGAERCDGRKKPRKILERCSSGLSRRRVATRLVDKKLRVLARGGQGSTLRGQEGRNRGPTALTKKSTPRATGQKQTKC